MIYEPAEKLLIMSLIQLFCVLSLCKYLFHAHYSFQEHGFFRYEFFLYVCGSRFLDENLLIISISLLFYARISHFPVRILLSKFQALLSFALILLSDVRARYIYLLRIEASIPFHE